MGGTSYISCNHPCRNVFSGLNIMARFCSAMIVLALVSGATAVVRMAAAQSAPPAPDKVWHAPAEQGLSRDLSAHPEQKYEIDATHAYSLSELIDLAQRHNPETREAWQAARVKAADLGVAHSQLFPTLTAVVLASSLRDAALLSSHFDRQTEGLFIPELH